MRQKNAKENEICKEIARNDTEMGCDGGDLETNFLNDIYGPQIVSLVGDGRAGWTDEGLMQV